MHQLENDQSARAYFTRIHRTRTGSGVPQAAYRRAVLSLTGSLPTWAEPGKPGPKSRTIASKENS